MPVFELPNSKVLEDSGDLSPVVISTVALYWIVLTLIDLTSFAHPGSLVRAQLESYKRQAHLDLATIPNCHGTTGYCLFDNAADGFLLLSLDRDSSKPLQEQQNSSMTPHFPDALNSLH